MALRPKIVVIGAGSLSHGKRFIDDLLTVRTFLEGELVLVGNNPKRLAVIAAYAERVMAALRPGIVVTRATSSYPAVEGADLVFTMFDAGGFPAFKRDGEITTRYGLDTCIGDTAGPLGALRALRNAPIMLELAAAMRKSCPDALLVNYVNPMAPMVSLAASTGIDACVGICGGIEATRSYVAKVLRLPKESLRTSFAGLNHLCWLLEMWGPEGDLYPRFRELMADPVLRGEEAVRFEMLQQFGYFVSESSGHLSDFFPFFRRNAALRGRYCAGTGYSGAPDAYLRLASFLQRHLGDADYLEGQNPAPERSSDYGAAIVDAWLGGPAYALYGNVMNAVRCGLPESTFAQAPEPVLKVFPVTTCVEVPVQVGQRRLEVRPGPPLPIALAGLCAPLAFQHTTLTTAILDQDPDLLVEAIAQDSLTTSILDLPSIRRLTTELLTANAEWLPEGFKRAPRPTVDAGTRSAGTRQKSETSPELELVRNYEHWKQNRRKDP